MKYEIWVKKLILIISFFFLVEIGLKSSISFKGPPAFHKNIKNGYIIIKKQNKNKNINKLDINEKLKGRYKSEGLKHAIKILKHLTSHEKKVSICLMIILRFHLRLNIDQFTEKNWKY